jgi:hypothetical protein
MLGCDSLSDFNKSFSGSIIAGSFVRSCFAENLKADLRFDPAKAQGSTQPLPDLERNWLTLSTRDDPPEEVLSAPLEPIASLGNDTLIDFDFPGPKRLRNYMLTTRPKQGPLAGRDVLVVVSLLANKQVELRVIGRGEETTARCVGGGPEEPDDGTLHIHEYYGFFRLK